MLKFSHSNTITVAKTNLKLNQICFTLANEKHKQKRLVLVWIMKNQNKSDLF